MKKIDQLILIVGIVLIIIGVQYLERNAVVPAPSPNVPLVVPDIVVPPEPKVPDTTITVIDDNCNEALRLSKLYKKSLVLIFGASWCPYCKDLKKDIQSIKSFEKTIVCLLDVEKNEKLVNKYGIKGLPTSIIINHDKEKSRKSGYKKHDYETWLNGNL